MPAFAAGEAVIPIEKERGLDLLPLGEEPKKALPEEGRVNINREEISDAPLLNKKDPLVSIAEPQPGVTGRSFQKVSGKVGGGIAKIFLRINEDTQVVAVNGGAFETYCALRPGLNRISAIAWDLEGNLGKDSMKLIYKPARSGPAVALTSPKDGVGLDITADRVIEVAAKAADKGVRDGYLVVNNIPRRVSFEKGAMRQGLALFPGVNEIYVEAVAGDGRAGRSAEVKVETFDANPKDLVAVLTWDSPTADFDLHVWDSFGHHTFNDAPDADCSDASISGGSLDMDRKGGYGPEVFSLENASQEVYTFYVKYNAGLKEKGANAYLRILLHGDDPSRRILRSFGPVYLDNGRPAWEAAHVKMPEGVFFQEKDSDLAKVFGMDKKAIRRLALMLEEENPAFGMLAISAMGQIKCEESLPPLLKLLSGGTAETRRAAAAALWGVRSVKSLPALTRALKDDDREVRRLAAGALGDIGEKDACSALSTLLVEETDPPARIEAIRALGRLGDARALETLIPQAKDADLKVRVEAVRALGVLGEPRAEAALKEALVDKDADVRAAAARSMGMLRLKGSVKELADVLRFDDGESVRVQAARALGLIRDENSKADLENAARKDSSERVRFCAGKAAGGMQAPDAAPAPAKAPEPVKLDEDVVVY